ncbi:PAS domain S-box protein [Streptomyces kaempferi]|uniref:PAS domain S-box protein n=1 Tax=Streptomyces kaempferi TaxID=333725 RepID=A0ABW3XS65_9ACTN
MGSSATTAVSEVQATIETVCPAIALLDTQGTVVGWSQTAQRLVGYSAAEVVGRSAGVLLVAAGDRAKASHAAQESTLRGGWSDLAQVRHRDAHRIDVRLCVSSLFGQDGRGWWAVCATDKAFFPRGRPMPQERNRSSLRCRAARRSVSSYGTRTCVASR